MSTNKKIDDEATKFGVSRKVADFLVLLSNVDE